MLGPQMPGVTTSRNYKALDLSGARVLITGATSGIGKACAFRFQELKCHLILVGRCEQKLKELGMELYSECQKDNLYDKHAKMPELIWLNVENTEKIQELAEYIGSVDILVNNAGTNLGDNPVNKVKVTDMNSMVFTNFIAPMAFVSAFGPHMRRKGSGHIINICSTAADDVYANGSVYCSTKAALNAYSVAARHDLIDTPIRVSTISPGLVDTPLHEKKTGNLGAARNVFDGIVPLFPEDIADQIVYTATRPSHVQVADLSSYATNQSHSGVKGIAPVSRMGSSLGGPQSLQRMDFSAAEYHRRPSQDHKQWRAGGAQTETGTQTGSPPPYRSVSPPMRQPYNNSYNMPYNDEPGQLHPERPYGERNVDKHDMPVTVGNDMPHYGSHDKFSVNVPTMASPRVPKMMSPSYPMPPPDMNHY